MTPHSRSRQGLIRQLRLASSLVIWSSGCLLSSATFAGTVPTDRPAGFPAWWFARDVIRPINLANTSWVANGYPRPEDFAAANQGQLKSMVVAAVAEFNARLSAVPDTNAVGGTSGAGQALSDLVKQWTVASTTRDDYAAVNIGQLKAVTSLIYDRLMATGYYDQVPWAYNPAGVNDFATANAGQLKALFSFDVSGSPGLAGKATYDHWSDSGTTIADIPLTSTPGASGSPVNLTSLDSQTTGSNRSERLCGYIVAPTSGVYRFWLTASGLADLYISNDDDPVNSFLRAQVTSGTSNQGWEEIGAGKSTLLRLVAGKRYYFEVRHRTGSGIGYASVGWLKPGPADPNLATTPTEVVPGSALLLRASALPAAFTPPTPVPAWSDPESATSPESHLNRNAASRFLIQTTYGPSGWATDASYDLPAAPLFSTYPDTDGIPPAGIPLDQLTNGWTNATIAGPDVVPYDVSQVQATGGFESWINNQFTIPASKLYDFVHLAHIPNNSGDQFVANLFYYSWWRTAVTGRDQLRQRVAFALSEIMVISATALDPHADTSADYYDTLAANAFCNYRDILKKATLHPAMGTYLNMLGNHRPASATRGPNENYAREVMQLFSIGMNRLNPDGSLMRNAAGLPIPTYSQQTVEGTALAFTGWDFTPIHYLQGQYPWYPYVQEWIHPMTAYPPDHFTGMKDILNNVVLPGMLTYGGSSLNPYVDPATVSGLTSDAKYLGLANQEMDAVIDAIFKHPNCGPFVCRQLIQRLVTSNPSPGYLYRVVSKFNDDGSSAHVRGDMKAVIKAILLDPEARSASSLSNPTFGKQREPLSRIVAFARAFPSLEYPDATPKWINYWRIGVTSNTREIWQTNLGQTPLGAPSVFNFFRPDYQFPGILAQANMTTPEFQLTNEANVIDQVNAVYNAVVNNEGPPYDGLHSLMVGNLSICMDLRPWIPLTDNDHVGGLVDKLNTSLMAGQLSSTGTNVYYPAAQRSIVNAKQAIVDFISSKSVTAVSAPSNDVDVSITVAAPHCLADGDMVFFSSDIGGNFSPTLFANPHKGLVVTVTGPNTFTIPVRRTGSGSISLTGVAISRIPYDRPADRLYQIVTLLVNSPDFVIQK